MDPDETLRMESIPNLILSSLGIHSAQKNKSLFVKPETNINTQSASHKNLQVCEEATSSAQNPSQGALKACFHYTSQKKGEFAGVTEMSPEAYCNP